MLAFGALLEFTISYQALESRLPNVNAASAALTKVLLWWDGLGVIQQRMPASKEYLVDAVETALLIQHEAYVQGALASLKSKTGKEEKTAEPEDGEP